MAGLMFDMPACSRSIDRFGGSHPEVKQRGPGLERDAMSSSI